MKKLLQLALCTLLVLGSLSAWAQRTITGTVLSGEDNSALPGANVVVKGTTTGTATDANGQFSLTAPDGDVTITISSIGFNALDRVVTAGESSISVTLGVNVQVLQEAVVVGYGQVNRKDVTGSIATVSSKDFQKGVITTPEQLIAGKAAGVQITPNNGRPGSGSVIRIRGGSSLNASNDPLIVIDGVPVDNGSVAGAPSPLSLINPNDIESITILKDASATAIYGSRASNGVILIITKKGVLGAKPQISISSQNSVSIIPRYANVLTADEFRAFVNEVGTPAQRGLLSNYNTNWQKEIFQAAISSDNTVALSGAYKTLPYRLSVGYLNQQGVLMTDKLERATAALTLTPSFFDGHLKVNTNLKGTISGNRFADQDAIGNATSFDPTKPVRDTTGSGRFNNYFEFTNRGLPTGPRNPVSQLLSNQDKSTSYRSIGNVQLDYAIHGFEDLRVNVNAGYDVSRGQGTVVRDDSAAADYIKPYRRVSRLPDGTEVIDTISGGISRDYESNKRNLIFEAYLSYSKEIPAIRTRVEALAGYSYQDFLFQEPLTRNRTFRGDTIRSEGFLPPTFPENFAQSRLISTYGRVNLSILDQFLLTGTIRRDGSSKFGPDQRYGIFPSFAAAWRVSQLGPLRNVSWLSDLKLRFGYGVTGQQDIGDYRYLPYYTISNNDAQYQLGGRYYQMYRPNAFDPDLKWEETQTYNFGIDFALFKDRISATVDYYRRFTYDLLNEVNVPLGTNFAERVTTNLGDLKNVGLELGLNLRPVQTRNWSWDVGLNYTVNRNELTRLTYNPDSTFEGIQVTGVSGGTGNLLQIQTLGSPINSFYVYQQLYDSEGRLVEGQVVDRNGDGVTDAKDRYRFKAAAPPIYYGINTTLTYKRISLSTTLRGAVDNWVYNNNESNMGRQSVLIPNTGDYLLNLYGTVVTNRIRGGINPERQFLSDYYLRRADFLRCDNINVAYNVGDIWKERVGLTVNFTVQNAFVITKYQGSDPEIAGGVDNNFYPRPRVFVVGLNLNVR